MTYKTIVLLCLTVALTGCGSRWMNDTFYNSEIIQARDFAPLGKKFNPTPVYCYKTLGGADCFAEPQSSREGRLIESYNPAPYQPPRNESWFGSEETHIEMSPIPLNAPIALH